MGKVFYNLQYELLDTYNDDYANGNHQNVVVVVSTFSVCVNNGIIIFREQIRLLSQICIIIYHALCEQQFINNINESDKISNVLNIAVTSQ